MTTADLDGLVLAFVTARPGSTVWDLTGMFPALPAPARPGDDDGLFGLPAPNPRTVPSVSPARITEALARLRRDGRVLRTRDPGAAGVERWAATL